MGNCPWSRMSHKLANGMKMWKRIGNTTTLLFSLNGLTKYMMVLPEVKYAGIKIVPQSDFRFRTTSRRIASKEINFFLIQQYFTWNLFERCVIMMLCVYCMHLFCLFLFISPLVSSFLALTTYSINNTILFVQSDFLNLNAN